MTELQYYWAINRVEELLPLVKDDTPVDAPESIELELLSNLVADYSDAHFSIVSPMADCYNGHMISHNVDQSLKPVL